MHVGIAAAIIAVGLMAKGQFDWIAKYPRKWVVPLKVWITDFFEWLVYGIKFFEGTSYEFVPTDIDRGMIKVFVYQVSFTEELLFNGFRIGIEPFLWTLTT